MLLVTGGAGFFGSNFILDWLAQHAAEPVVNLDKLTYAGNPRNLAALDGDAGYRLLHADICDRDAVDRAFAEHRPRAVVHFAAESHVDRSIHAPADFIQTNVVRVNGRRPVYLPVYRQLGASTLWPLPS